MGRIIIREQATPETPPVAFVSLYAKDDHVLYMVDENGVETVLATLPIIDATALVKGSADSTKQVRFEVDGLTTGNVRVLTVQDKDIIIAGAGVNSDITSMTGLDNDGIPIAKVANAISDATFTQDSGIIVGTGAGAYQEETGHTLRTSLDFGTMFPTHYERVTRPARTAVDTLTVYAGTVINVNEKIFTVGSNTALDLNVNANWDTGTALNDAARAGHDYYVYACDNSDVLALLVSADSTTPTGYNSDTSRKIIGFHCLCVAVGTIGGHTLTGFAQGEILPQSVWDLKHRPIAEPAGMVWSDEAQLWVDIYLASGVGGSTVSVYNGTISDTRNWMDFVDDFGAVKKQLLDDIEFQLIAAGSNEETNISGSADPITTGGNSDTASQRMISNIGCEDCCGAMRQWLRDQSAMYDGSIVAGWYDLPGSKGSLYRPVDTNDVKLNAGGDWSDAAACGSRCRYAIYYRWDTAAALGGRGRSLGI